jgi:Ca2+-binding EF-hand superfamily protein
MHPMSRSNKFSDRIFTIFDQNRDKCLDFGEFLEATRLTQHGTPYEKLKIAFQIYDLKGDGKIDKREMKEVLIHLYSLHGDSLQSKTASYKVDLIFERFDTDKDDYLSFQEFMEVSSADEYLNQLLTMTFSPVSPVSPVSSVTTPLTNVPNYRNKVLL